MINTIFRCTETQHAATINDLAEQGRTHPTNIRLADGTLLRFNSCWAATERWVPEKYDLRNATYEDPA